PGARIALADLDHTDAAGELHRLGSDFERRHLERLPHALGSAEGVARSSVSHEDEIRLSREARHAVEASVAAHHPFQALADAGQHIVGQARTKPLVDARRPIDIDKDATGHALASWIVGPPLFQE